MKPGEEQTQILNQTLIDLDAKGENTLISTTPCHIRIGIATRPSGRAALTSKRLIWQWRREENGEIPLIEINNISETDRYNNESLLGISWIVLKYSQKEIGIGFPSGEQTVWIEQIRNKLSL